MKLCCPACGSVFSLDVLLANDSARAAVMAALELPAPLGKLLIQYIALFRPAQRQLSFERVARLLEELRGPISEARIERNGRIWPAPQDTWKAAIAEMLALRDAQRLRLPLASHGYLFEIIASTADRLQGAAERKQEDQKRGSAVLNALNSSPLPSGGEGPGERAHPPKPPEQGVRTPQHFKDLVSTLGLGQRKEPNDGNSADPA